MFLSVVAAFLTDAPIRLTVDARSVSAQVVHVREELSVGRSRRVTVEYPKWIPGMHAPVGPIKNVTHFAVTAKGVELPWRRDPFEPYAFQFEVPKGTETVTVSFDYQPRKNETDEVAYGVAASDSAAIINFSALLMVPRGSDLSKTRILPQLQLPERWKRASALEDNTETTLERLIDSPVYAGPFLKTVALGGDVPHTLAVLGDTEALSEPTPFVVQAMERLVAESGKLFGVRHYERFTYLLAQSSTLPVYGLEHHASSVNVLRPGALGDGTKTPGQWNANLLPHEFVHSWCGKFRRPYGLVTKTLSAPLSTDLLFVYEGLTEYLGEVLMVRAGFYPLDAEREHLRQQLSSQEDRKARSWQSLRDAAVAFPLLFSDGDGERWRFSNDVYYESAAHWLEADTIIRRTTNNARSLDDFCRVFFGGKNKGPEVRAFTEADVVGALRDVLPSYNWERWFHERFDAVNQPAPRAGLEAAGWRYGLGEVGDSRKFEAETDFRQSLGVSVGRDGTVIRVTRGPLALGQKIVTINGAAFTSGLLRETVRATKNGPAKIDLGVATKDATVSVMVECSGGEQLPVLLRTPEVPDLLGAIFAPTAR